MDAEGLELGPKEVGIFFSLSYCISSSHFLPNFFSFPDSSFKVSKLLGSEWKALSEVST